MDRPNLRRSSGANSTRTFKPRRPTGVSRRRRKQLGFETLEDRRVMSAQSPLAYLQGDVNNNLGLQVQSTSSATPQGLAEIMQREMYWQALAAMNLSGTASGSYVNSIPTDPFIGNQWHLINTGQQVGNPDFQPIFGRPGEDINVAPVWNQGITGRGVTVAVIDTGVQRNHPDLAANITPGVGFDNQDVFNLGNPVINILSPLSAHGTSVAGLIGAVADNGLGGSGVSPGVKLIPIRAIESPTNVGIVDSFRYALLHGADITNNSWGSNVPRDIASFLAFPTPQQFAALRDTITDGRNGLGMINVFASGNSAGPVFDTGFTSLGGWDFAGYDGWVNTRYTIGVTGVDHDGFYNNVDGTVTAYPEISAAVLVAAPTGSNAGLVIVNDDGIGSGMWTTDLTGEFGFNAPPNANGQETEDPFFPFDRDFYADSDYTSRFNGTSAASPVVSGVVALMLEANPNLTWRDVQEILVRSARQNAQFEVPRNGLGQGLGLGTQNLWIVNQTPVFHDPDPWIQGVPIDPLLLTLNPTLDPNVGLFSGVIGGITSDHHQPTPIGLTNGAGYTVSMGSGFYAGEAIGYGHGVIDAEMAVLMAQQWHAKEQALPGEQTFTTFVNTPAGTIINIPGAEQGVLAGLRQIVPGGIGGAIGGGFISFWNEYFTADAFQDPNETFPFRGGPITFSVPISQSMSVESVEVKLSISGGTAELMDHMRILLVSPEGTHSELNHFWVEPPPDPGILQNDSPALAAGEPGSLDNGGQFVWTFNTKRSWGERTNDAIVFDPTTGEPVIDEFGLSNLVTGVPGAAMTQGWRLVIENYNFGVAFDLDGVEVAWHGSPVAAESQRVQGFVGIDQNRDDLFNYSRINQTILDLDQDPNRLRFGEVVNDVDLTQESFAKNVTVTVRRTVDNSLVDQFVTGHDGNFYFDLVPDDYTITVEDPAGRTALDDGLTGAQFERHYRSEWQITAADFRVWDHDPNFPAEVLLDPITGRPAAWLDDNGLEQAYGMKGINFLLDPGPVAPAQVVFQGTVQADTNGDGVFNPDDVALPGVSVFGDINRNGIRDPGEVTAVTNAAGQYTLTVPINTTTVVNVGVIRPTGWTSTNDGPGTVDTDTDGLESFFVRPGDTVAGVNFSIDPPANNTGGGGANQPGYLMGVVFADLNGDGVRQSSEVGAAGFRVYIDNNNSGGFDAGDTQTTTNQFGAWAFGNVAPGQRIIRLEAPSPFAQTVPGNNAARVVSLTGSSTISAITFGVRNTANLDFGDLPAAYPTASHRVGAYWLGATVDAELNSQPSVGGDADDQAGIPDDEDGIEFVTPFTAGGTATVKVTASRNNGYLQGWADWNNDGDLNDVGERIITNRLLHADANQNFVNFAVPANAGAQVYLRFRYGEFASGANAISTPSGQALTGEVEDYLKSVPAVPAVIAGTPADFDQDTDVDGRDFLAWQRNFGRTTGSTQAQGNANTDGAVNGSDLNSWKNSFGSSSAAVTQTADFNADQVVDGRDFLAMQRNFGTTTGAGVANGDSNGDGRVNIADVSLWKQAFGVDAAAAAEFAALQPSSSGASSAASVQLSAVPIGLGSVELADAASQWTINSQAAQSRASVAPARRATFDLASRFDVETLGAGLESVRELVQSVTADAGLATVGDYHFWRRDRVFEDLLGSRRRQGLRAEVDGATDEATVDDCDEVFAALADHVEWPLG